MGEWRRIETPYTEDGHEDRLDVTYEFGAEVEGVWVPAVTKTGGYVDHLIATGKANQQASSSSDSQAADTTTPAAEAS